MPNFGLGANAVKEIMLNGGELEFCLTVDGDITAATAQWMKTGYTDKDAGGVLSDKQPSFKGVKVTGLTDDIKRKAGEREVTFKTTLKQFNLEALKLATGGSDADVLGTVLGAPTGLSAVIVAGGDLIVATDFYLKVVALDANGKPGTASAEIDSGLTNGPNRSITVTWTAVPGAYGYRVYFGTVPGAQSTSFNVTSGGTSFTVTTATGALAGTIPAATGKVPTSFLGGKSQAPPKIRWRYTVKNPDDSTLGKRLYLMNACVQDSVEVQFADDKETGIQLTIRAYEAASTVLLVAASLEDYRYIVQNGTY